MPKNGPLSVTKSAARIIVSALAISALSVSLVGCTPVVLSGAPSTEGGESSSPVTPSVDPSSDPQNFATLEAFVASQQGSIADVMAQFEGTYSDFRLEAEKPGTIVFTYVFANMMDPVASAANFEKTGVAQQLQEACDKELFPAMEAAGIQDPMMARYVYLNADGKMIWQKDFARS